MKTLIVGIVAVSLYMAPALAIEQKGRNLKLSADEQAACKAGGGCIMAPRASLEAAFQEAFEAGKKAASCSNSI